MWVTWTSVKIELTTVVIIYKESLPSIDPVSTTINMVFVGCLYTYAYEANRCVYIKKKYRLMESICNIISVLSFLSLSHTHTYTHIWTNDMRTNSYYPRV